MILRRQEIHTAEPLVPDPSALEIEIAIEKLKILKSPGIDQIPAELIILGGRKIHSEISKFINSIWNKEEWPQAVVYGGGVEGFKPSPKFRSFDKVEPDCKLSGKYLVFLFQHPN